MAASTRRPSRKPRRCAPSVISARARTTIADSSVRTEGGGWAISYVPGEEDDERMIRLDTHVFRIGEYVSISEHGAGEQAFRVTSIDDVALSH